MSTAVSYSKTGSKHDATVKLDKAVFGVELNHDLVGQAYRTYLANGRSAHASTLKRGEVAGGGKKPWRQKGTGRARVGSIRVPNWRGGGNVFGPTGHENHTLNMPIRMKRLAIRQALSARAAAGDIVVIETFDATEGKVKPTVALLGKMNLEGNILIAVEAKDSLVERATRNIAGLKAVQANYLNVFDIMNADKIVITQKSLEMVNEWLGDNQ
jgi:large subunit ribosomal protein L4